MEILRVATYLRCKYNKYPKKTKFSWKSLECIGMRYTIDKYWMEPFIIIKRICIKEHVENRNILYKYAMFAVASECRYMKFRRGK